MSLLMMLSLAREIAQEEAENQDSSNYYIQEGPRTMCRNNLEFTLYIFINEYINLSAYYKSEEFDGLI